MAIAAPTGSAQEPEPVGGAGEGYINVRPGAGKGVVELGLRIRCATSPTGNAGADCLVAANVSYTVTDATRMKYKLPSKTLASAALQGTTAGNASTQNVNTTIKPSAAMTRALLRIKSGRRFTVKVKVAFTSPIVEAVTDTTTVTVDGGGPWSVATRNIAGAGKPGKG